MPYDTVPGSTDPTTLDGGVYSPIPNDPAVLIESFVEANVAASAASAAAAAASAAAALASQGAANTSAIAAAASQSAAASSASSASASASAASTAATSAAGSASAAGTSATNAAASATAASNSASAAATSASNASSSASAASSSASAAAASAAAALTSENNAAASFVAMDQKYLGAKASNPAVNNQGGALAAGMLYFNTGSNELRMYTGSVWIGVPGVLSFNTRTGAVTLTSLDVTTALGFTPVDGSAYLLKAGGTMSGALLGAAGTVGAPGFAFSGDANNGWWAPAADTQAWSVAGVEAMRLNSSGNLVLGTATSISSLNLQLTVNRAVQGAIAVGHGDGSFNNRVAMFADSSTQLVGWDTSYSSVFSGYVWRVVGSEKMRIDSAGQVGIGTTPLHLFHLNAASGSTLIRLSDSTPRTLGFMGSGSGIISTASAADLGLRAEANLVFASGGNNERMRVDSSGNLLLGTTSSNGTRLKLDSGANPWFTFGASSAAASYGQYFRGGTTTIGGYIGFDGGALIGTGTGTGFAIRSEADLILMSAAAERLRIDSSGRVNVGGGTPQAWGPNRRVIELGTASDQSYIFGYNTVSLYSNVYFDGSNFRSSQAAVNAVYQISSNNHAWFSGTNGGVDGITTLTQNMTLDGNGQLGIGLTNPTSLLDVSKGGTPVVGRFRAAAGFAAGLQMAGNNNTAGTTSFDLQQDSAGNADIVQRNNARLSLYTNGTERMRITGAGVIQDAGGLELGWKLIPQNSKSAAYTVDLTDTAKHIFHPSADTTARTFTIPANGAIAFPIGTAITFINQNGAGVVTIAITTDTMRLAGAGTTGSRTLAANGIATAIKVTSTEWIISGTGLT